MASPQVQRLVLEGRVGPDQPDRQDGLQHQDDEQRYGGQQLPAPVGRDRELIGHGFGLHRLGQP
jgi:hypothetical protein